MEYRAIVQYIGNRNIGPSSAKQLARQGIEYILPLNRRDNLCLCFCLHPSSMMESWNPLLPFFRNFAQSSKLFTALNELCSTSSEPVCKDIAHIFIIYFINWNVEGTWDWLVTSDYVHLTIQYSVLLMRLYPFFPVFPSLIYTNNFRSKLTKIMYHRLQ